MDFYTVRDVPREPGEVVYRYRLLGVILVTLLLTVIGAVLLGCGLAGGITGRAAHAVVVVLTLSGVCVLAVSRLLARTFSALLDPAVNWLMRCTPNGLVIKFRSPLDGHSPVEEPAVVRIAWHEIEWARRTREVRVIRSRNRHRVEWITNLDLKVRSDDLPELVRYLAAKRSRETSRGRHGRGRSRGRVRHDLVTVTGPFVRVAWIASPRLDTVLQSLRGRIQVAPPIQVKEVTRLDEPTPTAVGH